MFAIECPVHRSQMLLPEGRIRSLRNTDSGITIDVECYCGHTARIHTGRRRQRTGITN